MNIKKIKLDLTVKFLNLKNNSNLIQSVKDAMLSFGDEVGNMLEYTVLRDTGIGRDVVNRTYAIRYENCTLNVDLVVNRNTKSEYLKSFQLN